MAVRRPSVLPRARCQCVCTVKDHPGLGIGHRQVGTLPGGGCCRWPAARRCSEPGTEIPALVVARANHDFCPGRWRSGTGIA